MWILIKLSSILPSNYGKGIFHVHEASKLSIDIDMEHVPDVKSCKTENSHVFENGNGHVDNTLAVDANDGEEE